MIYREITIRDERDEKQMQKVYSGKTSLGLLN